jgi:hypothetical protein
MSEWLVRDAITGSGSSDDTTEPQVAVPSTAKEQSEEFDLAVLVSSQ